MIEYIFSALIGVVCIVLGISNMNGNISSIHSYHRQRVSEENILPFGRLVGLGTIIVGAGIIFFSIMSTISELVTIPILSIIGIAVMFIGIFVGLGVSIYAMKKYNGGVF